MVVLRTAELTPKKESNSFFAKWEAIIHSINIGTELQQNQSILLSHTYTLSRECNLSLYLVDSHTHAHALNFSFFPNIKSLDTKLD